MKKYGNKKRASDARPGFIRVTSWMPCGLLLQYLSMIACGSRKMLGALASLQRAEPCRHCYYNVALPVLQ